jgi:hypothetical protein
MALDRCPECHRDDPARRDGVSQCDPMLALRAISDLFR